MNAAPTPPVNPRLVPPRRWPPDESPGSALQAQDEAGEALLPGEAIDAEAWGEGLEAHEATELAGAARLPAAADEDQLCAWIAAVGQRDDRALAALYDATLSRVYGLVMRIVRTAALADEVVEDTYFQVWRQALRFDATRGRALTWLLAMARSRAIDALRREARFQHASLDAEDGGLQEEQLAAEGCAQEGSDELLDIARQHAALHRALLELNAQPRQLVALAFFRGLSHEEIATQTALPLGTVKSQIRRALMTLRDRLGDAGLAVMA
jgi:RNA polymerase sigma factor (sigma-70 family)